MLKKSIILIVMLTIMFVLFGCESFRNSGTNSDSSDLLDSQKYLTYHTWTHSGKYIDENMYMDAHFTDPYYMPFTQSLSFNIVINDLDFSVSEYFLITRNKGSYEQQSSEKIKLTEPTATIHKSIRYHVENEVIIIKVNRDIYFFPGTKFEPMAKLWVDDQMASSRVYYEGGYFVINPIHEYVNLKIDTPYIDFSFRFEDTKRCITKLHVEVYHEELKEVVATKVISFTEDMYENDIVSMMNIKIGGLSPKTKYIVKSYFSGTDGVSTYEHIYAFERVAISTDIISKSTIVKMIPSLWGVIIDYQKNESTTTFNYYLDNMGLVTFNNMFVDVVIGVYNQSGDKIKEYPVVHGRRSVVIDNQYLSIDYELKFEVVQTKEILSKYVINFKVSN